MCAAILFLLAVALVTGTPLTEKENEELQQKWCGSIRAEENTEKNPFASESIKKVMKGALAQPEEAPWTVGLEIYFRPDSAHACTGSLISNRHVVTAGHCMKGFKQQSCETPLTFELISGVTVAIGSSCGTRWCEMPYEPKQVKRVARVFLPKLNGCNKSSDLAILELSENVTFTKDINPACLSAYEPVVGDSIEVFGYGFDPAETNPEIGKEGVLKKHVTKVEKCQNDYMDLYWFCTGTKPSMTCQGDSGAGMIYRDPATGRPLLSGIVSTGTGDCPVMFAEETAGRPDFGSHQDFNTQVSAHISWICQVAGVCVSEDRRNKAM